MNQMQICFLVQFLDIYHFSLPFFAEEGVIGLASILRFSEGDNEWNKGIFVVFLECSKGWNDLLFFEGVDQSFIDLDDKNEWSLWLNWVKYLDLMKVFLHQDLALLVSKVDIFDEMERNIIEQNFISSSHCIHVAFPK